MASQFYKGQLMGMPIHMSAQISMHMPMHMSMRTSIHMSTHMPIRVLTHMSAHTDYTHLVLAAIDAVYRQSHTHL